MKEVMRRKIGYWLGACALFAIFIIFCALWENREQPTETPDILILGDSLFANDRGDGSISNQLREKLGLTIADCSMGGTSASYLDKEASLAHTLDAYCLAALVRATIAGDYRVQINARFNSQITEYFDERIAVLKTVDLSKVKILVIDHCINDYQAGVAISDEQNPYNEYTYSGALRYALKNLQTEYPDLRIVIMSPTRTWYTDRSGSCSEVDFGGGTLDEYVAAQREVAEEFGVEWIDLFTDLYPEGDVEIGLQVTSDGIHPNETGKQLITERLAEYLQ